MKITKAKLKQIIQEEFGRVSKSRLLTELDLSKTLMSIPTHGGKRAQALALTMRYLSDLMDISNDDPSVNKFYQWVNSGVSAYMITDPDKLPDRR